MKKIGIGFGIFALLIGVLLIVISLQPATYHVERTLEVKAPANVIFDWADDYKSFEKWNPWLSRDPDVKLEFIGPESGEGASYTWQGNDEVGSGKMTILEVTPGQKVTHKVEFKTPFESEAETTITLGPSAGMTPVTWSMDGKNDFMGKAFSLVFDMDDAIGADYEKGLATLKSMAEKDALVREAAEIEELRTRADKEEAMRAADKNAQDEGAKR